MSAIGKIALITAIACVAVATTTWSPSASKPVTKPTTKPPVQKKMDVVKKIDNVSKFQALMRTHGISERNEIEINPVGDYLDRPVQEMTFYGIDAFGRAFVNLSVTATGRSSWGLPYTNKKSSFVVFQRYADDTELFVLGGVVGLRPLDRDNFLNSDENNFDTLNRLLSRQPVRFSVEEAYKSGGVQDTNWVEIKLAR